MTHRFEPSVGNLARQWAWAAVLAGGLLGLAVYFAERAAAWGGGSAMASFTFAVLRDYWLHFWTVEVGETGVRAVRGRTEYDVRWAEIIALEESYEGERWTIEWGKERTLAPHYMAPESVTFSLNAYAPEESVRLVESLRWGVQKAGVLEVARSGAFLPAR